MTRPHYETQASLVEERRIAVKVVRLLRAVGAKLPVNDAIDNVVLDRDGAIRGWLECKGRNKYSSDEMEKMGGVMLSFRKWLSAKQLIGGTFATKFWFAVALSDADYMLTVEPGSPLWGNQAVWWRGRYDRQDPADMEACVLLPMHLFENIGTAEVVPDKEPWI